MINLRKYSSKNPLKKFALDRLLKQILQLVETRNPRRILDLGCGEGIIMQYLKKHHPEYEFVGIDISAKALSYARKLNPQEKLIKATLYDLSPLRKEDFDLAICLEVLEHLASPEKALEEIKQINIKHLIVSVPWEPFFQMAVLLANFYSPGHLKRLGDNPDHLQRFNKKGLEKLLGKYFYVDKIQVQLPWLVASAQSVQASAD